MIKSILTVGVGSFFGGALRYLISTLMKGSCCAGFPWGTLTVNLLGCLAIGVILGLFGRCNGAASAWSLLLATGFCGGFTTFSTFANESLQMIQSGNVWSCIGYVAISVVLGVLLVAVGYWVVKI